MKKIKLFALAVMSLMATGAMALDSFTPTVAQNVSEAPKGTWLSTVSPSFFVSGDTLILHAYGAINSGKSDWQAWIGNEGSGSSSQTWDALPPFKGSSAYSGTKAGNAETFRSNRIMLFRVTQCSSVLAYVCATRECTMTIDAFEYVEGEITTTPAKTISLTTTSSNKNEKLILTLDSLSSNKEYLVKIYSSSTSSSNAFEIAFVADAGTKYKATFVSAHGTAPESATVSSIILPTLSEEGFLHTHWTANQRVVVNKDTLEAGAEIACGAKAILTAATTFTAAWETAYTVSYFDGTTLLGKEQVISGQYPKDYSKYETREHATFVAWSDVNKKVVVPGDSVITSAASFFGSWNMEVTKSSSINIEQLVLDNGKGYNIQDALTAANILYANIDALDSLNDSKTARNEPYLGLKIKTSGGYVEMGLKSGDYIYVKFGNVSADLKITINGVDSTLAKADAAEPFHYEATADCWVKVATTTSGTVVIKQIMVNEQIKEVILPPSPTTGIMETMMDKKAKKFILDGKVYFRHGEKIFNALGQEILF